MDEQKETLREDSSLLEGSAAAAKVEQAETNSAVKGNGSKSNSTTLKADIDASVGFLQRWRPGGPWVLTAIIPDGGTKTRTFDGDTVKDLREWLRSYEGKRNIYFSVNPLLRQIDNKAKKEDIAAMEYLHVDIDPRVGEDVDKERERNMRFLRDFSPPPTFITNSGNGVQAFWKLKFEEKLVTNGDIAAAEQLEAYNMQLEKQLQGDRCHNIDRIMRLPGTINLPNKRKVLKGRKPVLAEEIEHYPDRVYPLSDFTAAVRVQTPEVGLAAKPKVKVSGNIARLNDVQELSQWGVTEHTMCLIVQAEDPIDPTKYPSRSEVLFRVCCDMVRLNVPDDVIFSVITDANFGIGRSVLEKPNSERYALRQIERAKGEVVDTFETDTKGRILNTGPNMRIAIRKLGVRLSRDEFADRIFITGLDGFGPTLSQDAVNRLYLRIEDHIGVKFTYEHFCRVVRDEANYATYHPVRDYLDDLKWDGNPRLDTWLSVYGGAADSPYAHAIGSIVLIAAVRRVRKPGCKFDEMLVLESPQGSGKSTALRVLAGHDDWFTDDLPLNDDTPKVIERMAGKWIIEAAELKGMKKGDVEHLKAFLSRTSDRARLAYAKDADEHPRQCIIIGTTNSAEYLRDPTGNRRFWPVRVEHFDIEGLGRDRDQLWAEAAAREASGESIRLSPDLYGAASDEQSKRRLMDPWTETLDAQLADVKGKITKENVWRLIGKGVAYTAEHDGHRLSSAMKEIGWEPDRLRFGGSKPLPCFVKGKGEERNKILSVCVDPVSGKASVFEDEQAKGVRPPF